MTVADRAWERQAQEEAELLRKLLESDERRVLVVVLASKGDDVAYKAVDVSEGTTYQDAINYIASLKREISRIAQIARIDPDEIHSSLA